MNQANQQQAPEKLQKSLSFFDVFSVATGATLSAGFFLLPGIAASKAGDGLVISYLIAAIAFIPAIFSKVELATAMPRAGGMYYFLDRSLSPLIGTVGGLGTWLALVLKVAFALVGMGAYLALLIDDLPINYVAIGLAVLLGSINLLGAKKTGRLQLILLIVILAGLGFFVVSGIPALGKLELERLFVSGYDSIIYTAGIVFVSYQGVTKVVSLSEEIDNPGRNIPLGVFLSFITTVAIYTVGTLIMVLVLGDKMAGNLTPVASAAKVLTGNVGMYIVSAVALIAFISVANAGTLSASRYPLAMSRDYLLPLFLRRLSKTGTPYASVMISTITIVLIIAFLDPLKIAKLASAFQLVIFGLGCLSVIVMRESRIESYDPAYKSPFYPYMQILGILVSIFLIREMGLLPILFSWGLVILGIIWYFSYARKRVVREGAIYHLFERLGKRRDEGLDRELRGILKEKGLRKEDPFDEVVARAFVLDLNTSESFGEIVRQASWRLQHRVELTQDEIEARFLEGTRVGRTPVVTLGVALPHFKVKGLEHPEMVLVRSKPGVQIITSDDSMHKVYALFFLISPEENPAMHLRILAQIAEHVDDANFSKNWDEAGDDEDLKEVMLRDEGFLVVKVKRHGKSARLIGKEIRHVRIPDGTLITVLRRNNQASVPNGSTIIHEGDKLTIIGDAENLAKLATSYID